MYVLQVNLQIQSTNSSAAITRNETARAAIAVQAALAKVWAALSARNVDRAPVSICVCGSQEGLTEAVNRSRAHFRVGVK